MREPRTAGRDVPPPRDRPLARQEVAVIAWLVPVALFWTLAAPIARDTYNPSPVELDPG